MNMPGITISPNPSMLKLPANIPFSSKSIGNITTYVQYTDSAV